MYKKKDSVALAPAHLVSGADRKRLLRRLETRYPAAAVQKPTLEDDSSPDSGMPGAAMPNAAPDSVLLPKGTVLAVARFAAPSRAQLYTLDGAPAWLDTRAGRPDDLSPTVLTLWRAPDLLPRIMCRHADVSHFVIGGADLMLPGVDLAVLPDFIKGQLCSVSVPGNPAPFAIGRALLSSEVAQAARQGRLLELWHAFGDCLWALAPGRAVPNAGFDAAASRVIAVEEQAEAQAANGSVSGHAADVAATGDVAELAQRVGEVSMAADLNQHGGGVAQESAAALSGGERGEDAGNGACHAEAAQTVTPEQMDEWLESQASLLQALHRTVKDALLPLPAGALWAQHVLPARRAEWTLNVRASSHKKFSKLLQAYGGDSGAGLLSLRQDKALHEPVVTSINRRHRLYEQFRAWPLAAAAGAAQPVEQMDAVGDGGTRGLLVEELYRVSPNTRPIFAAVGSDAAAVYTAQEAGIVAVSYAKARGLEACASSPSLLLLDPDLSDALFKGVLKKGEPWPTELPKARLRESFTARLLPTTRLTRGDVQVVRKGALPPVQISVEKRQGNKRVTRILGTETFLLEPQPLAAELQRKFAASAGANPLPGTKAGGACEIVIQGDVAAKAGVFLAEAYGVPKTHVHVKAAKK